MDLHSVSKIKTSNTKINPNIIDRNTSKYDGFFIIVVDILNQVVQDVPNYWTLIYCDGCSYGPSIFTKTAKLMPIFLDTNSES